jgi:hypothetical protein
MKKKIFMYAGGLLVIAQACNSSETPSDVKVVTDTVVTTKTDTVTVAVPADADTAAIIAFYEAQHVKSKGTVTTSTKTKKGKKVSVDSDPIFESTDVIPVVVPVKQTAEPATPAKPETVVKIVHDVQMYYFIPDEKATFPGGEKAFDKYLADNLEYPEKALDAGASRTVYPTLFLDEEGHPKDVVFRYEPTIYGFQDEARRILMSSPRWNPAKVGGKAVKSKFTIPITFKIQ